MKNSKLECLSLAPLTDLEIAQINGGCEGIPCLGKIIEAIDNFWSGVVRGFTDGANAAGKTM